MNPAVATVRSGSRRKAAVFAVGIAVFFAAYTWLLDYQEAHVKAHLAELRTTDPDRYLSQIQTVVTFEQYLAEYGALKGYDQFRNAVPPFLLGRWALFPEPKRVSDSYVANECSNSISFQDGLVKISGEVVLSRLAKYRLDGTMVLLQLQPAADIAIRIVSYGNRLHHLELDLPGFDGPRYGYLCK